MMKTRKLGFSLALIGLFMLVDAWVIYNYGIAINLTVLGAVITGIIIAALMDIPPFFFSAYGFAVVMDDTCDANQRKKGRASSAIGAAYTLLILSALITTRVIQIGNNMLAPDYNNLFSDVLFTVIPLLTTAFAIVLGLRSYEKNEVRLYYERDRAEAEYNSATERFTETYNDLKARFAAFETESGTTNLMDAARFGGEEMARHIDALNRLALDEVVDRYRLHISSLNNILHGTLKEALLSLDVSGTGIGVITGYRPSEEFLRKATLLKEPDKSLKAMVERQINESKSRRRQSCSVDAVRRGKQ